MVTVGNRCLNMKKNYGEERTSFLESFDLHSPITKMMLRERDVQTWKENHDERRTLAFLECFALQSR
jgi:hypothetical protein